MSGLLALLGGAEHTTGCEVVDRRMLDETGTTSPKITVVLGATSPRRRAFKINEAQVYWKQLGLPVRFALAGGPDEMPRSLEALEDPDIVVLAGGHPWLLHTRYFGSPIRDRILQLWQDGVPLLGSSAGAMALCEWRQMLRPPTPLRLVRSEFALVPAAAASPHHDRFGLSLWAKRVSDIYPWLRILGLTDRTALVGRGGEFEVYGSGAVTLLQAGRSTRFGPGERLLLDSALSRPNQKMVRTDHYAT